ncbi:hypothetical protein ACHWQZ_G012126 [Mnemiopsis leidyi]
MATTSTALLKIVIGVILFIALSDAVALGNRPPWNQWSYAGRALKKRSETETQIEKESGELLLETRGKKGRSKKKGASLIIETESGKTIEAEKSMKIDEPDAISLNVECGLWEVCSVVDNEDSCIDIDSVCPCRKEASAMQPTPISRVKLLKKRECD